jgi:hypothetical protein
LLQAAAAIAAAMGAASLTPVAEISSSTTDCEQLLQLLLTLLLL